MLGLFRRPEPSREVPPVVVLVKAGEVKNPGSRGGRFHRTESGHIAYGNAFGAHSHTQHARAASAHNALANRHKHLSQVYASIRGAKRVPEGWEKNPRMQESAAGSTTHEERHAGLAQYHRNASRIHASLGESKKPGAQRGGDDFSVLEEWSAKAKEGLARARGAGHTGAVKDDRHFGMAPTTKADVRAPGSRGGKFHRTKSGKVVYGEKSTSPRTSSGKEILDPRKTEELARGVAGGSSHVMMHRNFPGWSPKDHREAMAHHDGMYERSTDYSTRAAHQNAATAHLIAATNPAPSTPGSKQPAGSRSVPIEGGGQLTEGGARKMIHDWGVATVTDKPGKIGRGSRGQRVWTLETKDGAVIEASPDLDGKVGLFYEELRRTVTPDDAGGNTNA